MNEAGCKRKFKVDAYVARHPVRALPAVAPGGGGGGGGGGGAAAAAAAT